MIKETILHIVITAVMFLFALLLYLLPDPYHGWLSVFLVLTAGSMLCSLLGNEAYALFVAAGVPAAAWLIITRADTGTQAILPYIRDILLASSSCLASGIIYRIYRVIFRAYLAGLIMYLIMAALTGFVFALLSGSSYTLVRFYTEHIRECWPGLLIIAAGLPLVTMILRQTGMMVFLRNE